MASTKSTASTIISSGDFVKIDGKGIALVKQQVCRDGAVMYIVQVCGCDFDVEMNGLIPLPKSMLCNKLIYQSAHNCSTFNLHNFEGRKCFI